MNRGAAGEVVVSHLNQAACNLAGKPSSKEAWAT
jgi:hypothetical protein